jgi:hypothetical protein
MNNLSEEARQERAEYFRKWRAENKDRVKKINANYWEKRAKKRNESETYSKSELSEA